jgi:hypothetical protein
MLILVNELADCSLIRSFVWKKEPNHCCMHAGQRKMANTLHHVFSMHNCVMLTFFIILLLLSLLPHYINNSLGCFELIRNVLLIELSGAFTCLFQFSRLEGAIEYTSSGYTL